MKELFPKAKRVLTVLGAAAVSVIVFATISFFCIKISVPDVVGKSLTEGNALLNEHMLRTEIQREYNDTIPQDTIIGQDVTVGEKLSIGSRVVLRVSNGEEKTEVPNVQKKPVDEAKALLENLQFIVKITESFDMEEKGLVISQDKAAGEKISKGSEIKITVSKGPDLVQMPDIVGKTLESAHMDMANAGLRIQTELQCSDSVAEGRIAAMEVDPGDMINRNSIVVVYVSAGVANTVGNTPANSSQWGRVAEQGDWVYYTNTEYNDYLYKMKKDGSQKQILAKDTAIAINVVGEWIYYTNIDSNNGGLYKIRLDGSEKTKLDSSKNYFVYVVDGWIYTQTYIGKNIYRMRTDGTEKKLICRDSCINIHIVGNWIYYTDSSNNTVYKVRTDGSEKTKIREGLTAYDITVDGNTIVGNGSKEYLKINTDGSGFLSYNEKNTQKSFLNACDGWVYFLEHKFSSGGTQSAFYKMRFDSSEKTKIMDINFKNTANYFINVAGDWLYFPNEDDHCYLYRVKTDGTGLEKVYQ